MAKNFLLAILASCVLIACGKTEKNSTRADLVIARTAPSDDTPGSFQVRWRLAEAANILIFSRGGNFRAATWTPKAGTTFKSLGGFEVLESPVPTTEFSISLKDSAAESGGSFPVLSTFSDGGAVLLTTHFQVASLSCAGSCGESDVTGHASALNDLNLDLIPAPGESVIVTGAGAPSPAEFRFGVMAYFGKQALKDGASFRYLADPKLPEWMLREIIVSTPRLLDLNARKLNRQLPAQPILFIPFQVEKKRSNATYSGTVLGRHVLLALFGPDWRVRSEETRGELLKFVAHESFHLWNASLFQTQARPGGQWLYEGSANAAAYFALKEIGAFQDAALADFQTETLNRCAVGLSSVSLPGSVRTQDLRNHYDCGALIEIWLHRSLQARSSSFWNFWSKMFDTAASANGIYTQEDFLALARDMAPEVLPTLSAMTDGSVHGRENSSSLETFLINAYAQSGVSITPRETLYPDWYSRVLGERALQMSLESDCGTRGYFLTDDEGIRLVGGPTCHQLKTDQRISEIGGFQLWAQGVQAYDYLRNACASRTQLEVANTAGETFAFPCAGGMPARPKFLVVDPSTRF